MIKSVLVLTTLFLSATKASVTKRFADAREVNSPQ